MRIINYGSLNIDHTYTVESVAKCKETVLAQDYNVYLGGKGLNQTIAMSRCGAKVFHAGAINYQDVHIVHFLQDNNVDTAFVQLKQQPTGHAIIQLDQHSQNSIIVCRGANGSITKQEIDEVFEHFDKGDMLVLQNEINNLKYIIDSAKAKGMLIALTPSPIDSLLQQLPLQKVDYLLLNEVEAQQITQCTLDFDATISLLARQLPNTHIIMTLGEQGVKYQYGNIAMSLPACKVDVKDTTAAGDTFAGYFVGAIAKGKEIRQALELATKAAAISVTRMGATPSIPTMEEVLNS